MGQLLGLGATALYFTVEHSMATFLFLEDFVALRRNIKAGYTISWENWVVFVTVCPVWHTRPRKVTELRKIQGNEIETVREHRPSASKVLKIKSYEVVPVVSGDATLTYRE